MLMNISGYANGLQADNRLCETTFENGFKLYMFKNSEPPDRVSMRLVVRRGSANESAQESGIAHFLEHMAFNGTKHFKAGEMVEYFQRIGMAFGADTNAHTSFEETVYKIDIPDADKTHIKDGIVLMGDYAYHMLLPLEQINSERGVILAEKTSRESASYLEFCAYWNAIFGPDSVYSKRLPIGDENVIKNAPRETFVKFYNENYSPENMALLVVGDFDFDYVKALAKEYLGGEKARGFVRPTVSENYNFAKASCNYKELFERAIVDVYTNKELKNSSVKLMSVKPAKFAGDSLQKREYFAVLSLANYALSRRLERLSGEENSPFTAGDAYSMDLFDAVDVACLDITAPKNLTKNAFLLPLQELAKALKFGFDESEINEAKAYYLNNYEQLVKTKLTKKTNEIANDLAGRISKQNVITSPESDYLAAKNLYAKTTAKEVFNLFKSQFADSKFVVFVSDAVPCAFDISTEVKSAANMQVAKNAEIKTQEFAYSNISGKYEIVEKNKIAELDLLQVKFANNVRANLKKTEFAADTVAVKFSFGNGRMGIANEKTAAIAKLGDLIVQGGLTAHTYEDIFSIFSGKTMSLEFAADNDCFSLNAVCSKRDLKSQLLLIRAYITNAAFRKNALSRIKKTVKENYIKFDTTPEGAFQSKTMKRICAGDARFGFPPEDLLMSINEKDVENFFKELLQKSYAEISIVGDFDDSAAEMLGEVFGTLEKRSESCNATEKMYEVNLANPEKVVQIDFNSKLPKGISALVWKSCPMRDIDKARAANLLASVLDDRMRIKIREQSGLVYSPFAFNNSERTYNFGILIEASVVDKSYADKIESLLLECAESLKTQKITQDEFDRAKKPIIKQIEKMRRTNAYWLDSVASYSQAFPEKTQWAKTVLSGYKLVSLNDVQNAADSIIAKPYKVRIFPKQKKVE